MAIGLKETKYSLVDESTGEVFTFNYGKMHIENGTIYIDAYGDDIADWFFHKYLGDKSDVTRVFHFNDLMGLKLSLTASQYNDVIGHVVANLYIEGHQWENDGRYRINVRADIDGKKDSSSSPNAGHGAVGLMYCYMDNEPYQGMSIYPAHFVHRFENGYFYKVPYSAIGNKPYYQPTNNASASQIDAGQYIGSVWDGYWSQYPSQYILRDYNTLGFSDSGNIGKQQPTVIEGFPFSPSGDGESGSKGGQGTMEDSSTPIPIDEPRTLFVGNLFRVYNMTVTALSELSNFLLDPSFTASVSKLFNDPMDYITSLVAIPFSAFGGNDEPITIGSVTSSISAKRLNNFIADLDCGEINFIEYFESFMDYSPYTRVTIYLPMIGYININVDAFQNDKLALKYRVDVLTGQCVAFLSNSKGLVASYNGNCAYHIPLRSRDYSQMISGIANATASTLLGGVSAPSFNGALNGALNFKPAGSVTTAGAFSGNSGVLTNRKPYIIIERPRISIPRSYPHNIGYKSEITSKLSDLHGFTTVKAIHLDSVVATAEEKEELETLILSGVVLP